MIQLFQNKLLRAILGIFIGGVLGYLYYHFIGCSSGACPITRNPVSSILYGSLMGFFVSSV
jgi:hypothetical protein